MKFCLNLLLIGCSLNLFGQLQSPAEFLPTAYGKQFTPHHLLVDYVEYVGANSNRVQVSSYGKTNEDRPLLFAIISTPENLAQLEAIRQNNLRKTGLLEGASDPALDRAIVWLSFGVHGNEAGGPESAMTVLHELADPFKTQAWLQNTIVLFDPSLNPDGYSRYSHWYRGIAAKTPNPEMAAREHDEPWPGGRPNHYLFDLNRDWAWQTQVETQQRIKVYQQWMPHIHVDVHEQYPESPYYFAPAAAPYHPAITRWQEDFQVEIGKKLAFSFDQRGWLYFTRESFDLYYPSYGDTYPIFNGSIGMTFEQAGHGIAGAAFTLQNGDTLTIQDRIDHHAMTTLSTIEMASKHARHLIENFEAYFKTANNNPEGNYKSFVIKGSNARGKLRAFQEIMDKNGIRYGRIKAGVQLNGYHYSSSKEESFKTEAGDLVISLAQPRSTLARVLLEPESYLEDSLTYDITAWSLPYAYGLEAYACKQNLTIEGAYTTPAYTDKLAASDNPYAYLAKWESADNARFLAALFREGIKARVATKPFRLEGQSFDQGTLIITRADNRKNTSDWDSKVRSLAQQFEQDITPVETGFSDNGIDLGSSSMAYLSIPKIAVLAGERTSSQSFGQIWHFFEQELQYPIYNFNANDLSQLDLNGFNLLILPEGRYSFNEETLEKLNNWVSGGGRIIAIGSALSAFADKPGFALSTGEDDNGEESTAEEKEVPAYADQERKDISEYIPGAIFKIQIDASHPLGYGLGDTYFSLKTDADAYPIQDDLWNVGYIGDELDVKGFAGYKAKQRQKNTMVFGVKQGYRGAIIYLVDNPLFRGFWENGKLLFSNAVFLAGQ